MITFNNYDKRWLEIVFYFLCKKIISINQKTSDLIDFIKGYRWTNFYDSDKLIKMISEDKILLNEYFIPSKHEFIVVMSNNDCRLRMETNAIKELIRDTDYTFRRRDVFHTAMKEEINKTEVYPKLDIPKIHETIYSFLLAIRCIADIIKRIKF